MKKLFLLLIITAFAVTVNAQSNEGYVGVQYVRNNIENRAIRFDRATDSIGINTSTTRFVTRNLGVTGEVGGNFGETKLLTVMGGLTLKKRSGRVNPFVRGLAGFSHVNQRNRFGRFSENGFAYALGGGLDVRLNPKLSLRVIQLDYLNTADFSGRQNAFRAGFGIAFN